MLHRENRKKRRKVQSTGDQLQYVVKVVQIVVFKKNLYLKCSVTLEQQAENTGLNMLFV